MYPGPMVQALAQLLYSVARFFTRSFLGVLLISGLVNAPTLAKPLLVCVHKSSPIDVFMTLGTRLRIYGLL